MSLVEDILDVLCMVLEYFGVAPEMLVPVWDSQLCGQYRSIVRMIGTNLPLQPTPRVHFQIPLLTYKPHGYIEDEADTPPIATFADVLWVLDYEGESFARTRNHLPPKKDGTLSRELMRNPRQAQRRGGCAPQTVDPEALQKITQLESELLKLQAQIAMIVTAAPSSALSSTPRAAAPPSSAPPPPPPPPPPPLCIISSETSSVMDLIRERRSNKSDDGQSQSHSGLNGNVENKKIPSMLDVLKDLNQVKLRRVERSPGGNPVKRRSDAALQNDPAALIARALKKKFAHHHNNSSSDKENTLQLSPFGSPENPQVSHHARRSHGRRHLLAC
ncbi:mitochondrial fission regulator 2 [Cyprinodon tularosa]|uniref:mitochondrial fission regulator 2 n=1 Tax=Cyprinodon tularosa TaxID=77115 RepID=UPI0018E207CE|nr:mitochondrial fission regulator 2 [Cyprinodon tularosa]